jgi:polyferredoxin
VAEFSSVVHVSRRNASSYQTAATTENVSRQPVVGILTAISLTLLTVAVAGRWPVSSLTTVVMSAADWPYACPFSTWAVTAARRRRGFSKSLAGQIARSTT